jgi:hypothetical protein
MWGCGLRLGPRQRWKVPSHNHLDLCASSSGRDKGQGTMGRKQRTVNAEVKEYQMGHDSGLGVGTPGWAALEASFLASPSPSLPFSSPHSLPFPSLPFSSLPLPSPPQAQQESKSPGLQA